MIDMLKRLFGARGSSSTAKERLRLVLMTDHLALGPEVVEQMKRDLVDVISRYVEVDRDKVEVSFEREDRALAMMANIPILSVARPAAPLPEPAPAPEVAPVAADAPPTEPPVAESAPAAEAPPVRRRRRRKVRAAAPAAATGN